MRARRQLLAQAINDLLASLMDEPAPWVNDWTKQLEGRLTAAEAGLRDAIEQRLSANFGASAWSRCVPNDIRQTVEQRIDQRARRNPFERSSQQSLAELLAQCNFGDYGKIIKSNWPLFEDIFGDKTTFERQMTAVQDARNAMAHHRAMNEGEQHTAAGGLYWFEQCLRVAAREENAEEAPEEDFDLEGELVGAAMRDAAGR